MAQNPYREQLLAQATQLNRGATRKISRLKTQKDVLVAGTEFDPRKPARLLKRYTNKQLETFIRRGEQFVARSTQFVPDAHHRPIPAAEWRDYKVAEQARAKALNAQLEARRDIPSSNPYETIGQRRDKMRSDRRLAGNPTVHDAYKIKERDSTEITSRRALKKLAREAKGKVKPGWEDKELKRQIGEFSKIVARLGDTALAKEVKDLTPGQFHALWNDSEFANALTQRYEKYQLMLVDGKDKPWYKPLIDNAFSDARREVDWAKNLDL